VAGKDGHRSVRPDDGRGRRADTHRAALDPAAAGAAGGGDGLPGDGGIRAGVLHLCLFVPEAAAAGYTNLEQAGWYLEDYHILQGTREEEIHATVRRFLNESGVPVESTKGEWGRGQHELNLRYADALEMADRHVLFKQCLKETADRMGLSVTFMAKFDAAQAGSSCHVHTSLWREGKNAFAGDRNYGPVQASDLFGWFLAGWIEHAPEFMVFYAPTVNSYKRYRAGSWAPTRLTWSYDNRTAAFRVVGRDESLRIECRIPGADCNPYLCFAAAIASGLDGMERRLAPPPAFSGDSYGAAGLAALPRSLPEAVERFHLERFRAARLGRGGSRALRALLPGGAGGLRGGGDGLGAGAVFRTGLGSLLNTCL
jgi:glutamine synthetase